MSLLRRPSPSAVLPVEEHLQRVEEDLRRVAHGQRQLADRRTRLILEARAQGLSLRRIAESTGLSFGRVRQLTARPFSEPPEGVSELDESWHEPGKIDTGHSRIFALATVAPDLPTWPTVRDFLADDPRRAESAHYDLIFEGRDVDPDERWLVTYVVDTREVCAWRADAVSPAANWDGERYAFSVPYRTDVGPVVALGKVLSRGVLEVGLGQASLRLSGKVGGLAWVYGRVQLLNRLATSYAEAFARGDESW